MINYKAIKPDGGVVYLTTPFYEYLGSLTKDDLDGWYLYLRNGKEWGGIYIVNGVWEIGAYSIGTKINSPIYGPYDYVEGDWRAQTREEAVEIWARRKKLKAFQ